MADGGIDLTLNRRGFLIGGGALTLMVGAGGLHGVAAAGKQAAAGVDPNAWITLSADDTIRIVFPGTELGQGSSTALPLIVAEELDADWDRVVVEQLDSDDRRYGNPIFGGVLYTAGSTGVYGYFDTLRMAGAQARALLIQAAARQWGVDAARLTTEPSVVVDPVTSKRIGYGALAGMAETASIPVPEASEDLLKPKSAFRLIGKDVPRRDTPSKTTGEAIFGVDVRVPGMLYGVVLRAPVEGETPISVDDSETLATPRVLRTVTLPDGVAVVAETLEAAFAGRAVLAVEWTETAPARAFDSDADLESYAEAAADLSQKGAAWSRNGDVEKALAAAERVVERAYKSDYAYHAQFEPMSAVASVAPGGQSVEVWIASQTQSWSQRTITETLKIPAEQVKMHMIQVGGSFGRRTELEQPYLRDALLASKAMERPVKVVWSREDDVKFGRFRPAAGQFMSAGLAADGKLTGWRHRVAAPSVIAYFNPIRWSQVAPQDIISMRGAESKFYDLPDKLAEHIVTERRARIAPWRGIGAAYTSFAAEAFMDELAEEAGKDPIAFRMEILRHNPRGRWLLEQVRDMSGWGRPAGDTALGVAFAGYGDAMAAGIAEVGLDADAGQIRVTRFWAAVDAGLIVSPNNSLNQIEGGILFGVGSALKERITIKGGEVEQNNYYDYEILRMDEAPEVEVVVADVDDKPKAVGEVGTPMVAAAIANGFHALTGRRLRHMPFTPDRVLSALS